MKRKLYYWVKKHVNSDNIKFILLLIPLCIVLINNIIKNGFDFTKLLDTDILITFIIVALCDVIAQFILKFIQKKCEDSAKLLQDYPKLVKKYSSESLIEYQGNRFPITCLYLRPEEESVNIKVLDNPQQYYQLPSQAADFSQELMAAHGQSDLYNQICIRLENITIQESDNTIILHTSRTFYFDSMITNRACDYQLSNGKTIREIYEPGPYLLPLNHSKMSNHLGFNGFVMTSDGKIPFIMRSDNLSIGKNTLADSIGASLKTKYAIDCGNDYTMTKKTLGNAILCEIVDELALCNKNESPEQCLQRLNLTPKDAVNSIFAIYRDIVECGKPQFLFFLKLNSIKSSDLLMNFTKRNTKKTTDMQDKVIRDGKKMIFLTLAQLESATISADKLTVTIGGDKQEYVMMPSASASIVMLLKHLKRP